MAAVPNAPKYLAAIGAVLFATTGRAAPLELIDSTLSAIAIIDVQGNVRGGIERGIEVPTTIDLVGEAVFGRDRDRPAHKLKILLQGTMGGDISGSLAGDVQGVSSIEGPNTLKFFEAWYQYTASELPLSMLIGLHDLNTEYYVLERASLLLNGSFGNGPELSQANASLFPVSAVAAVVRFDPTSPFYLSAAIYDGIPGKPSDPHGTHIRFDDGDGVFSIAEIGLAGGNFTIPAKVALGVWHSSAKFNDTTGRERSNNAGLYAIGEAPLPIPGWDDSIGVFFQFGLARAGRNIVDTYVGAGVHWGTPFGRRNGDALSLGIAHASLSPKYRRASAIDEQAETSVEITYSWQLNPWLSLQPDVQYVFNPSTVADLDDALVVGCRIVLSLE